MNLNAKQKQEAVNYILDCYNYSKSYFHEYYTFCKALHSLSNVETPDRIARNFPVDFPGLVPTDILTNVEDLTAALYEILFSLDYVFKCNPEEDTPELNARKGTTYMKKATELSDLKMEFIKSVISAIKYARGVGYVDAVEMEIPRLKWGSLNPEQGRFDYNLRGKEVDFVKEKVIVPRYVPLQLRRHFPEPVVGKPTWAIQQDQTSFIDLLQELEKGENSKYDFDQDELWKQKESFPKGEFDEFYNTKQASSATVRDLGFWVELLHFRGWLPIWDERRKVPKFVDAIATVANRNTLIQIQENQWHYPAVDSFIYTHLFPSDQEQIIPVGKIEASFDTFLHKFYVRNEILKNLVRTLNTPLVTDDRDIPQFITAEAGKIYRIRKGSKLEPLGQVDVPNKALMQVDVFTDEILNTFHNTRYTAGQDPRRKETATGVNVLKQGVEEPRKFQTQVIIGTGLLKVARKYLDIGQLYFEQMPMRLFDTDEIALVGRENIFGEFNISLNINDTWNDVIKRQERLQSMQIFKDDPDINQKELKRRFFRGIGETEVNKLVPEATDEEMFVDKENRMMVQYGVFMPVDPRENHLVHFKGHSPFANNPIVAEHLKMTQQAFQQQQNPLGGGGGQSKAMGTGLPLAQNESHLLMQVAQRMQPKNVLTQE